MLCGSLTGLQQADAQPAGSVVFVCKRQNPLAFEREMTASDRSRREAYWSGMSTLAHQLVDMKAAVVADHLKSGAVVVIMAIAWDRSISGPGPGKFDVVVFPAGSDPGCGPGSEPLSSEPKIIVPAGSSVQHGDDRADHTAATYEGDAPAARFGLPVLARAVEGPDLIPRLQLIPEASGIGIAPRQPVIQRRIMVRDGIRIGIAGRLRRRNVDSDIHHRLKAQ